MMKLGIRTFEISQDLDYALKVADEIGAKYVELGFVWGKNVGDLTKDEIKKVKNTVKRWNITVSCVAPGIFFGVPLRADSKQKSYWGSYDEHLQRLKHSITIAKELDTNLVGVWGFANDIWLEGSPVIKEVLGDFWDMILKKFEGPLRIAERENIILAIETCFINNPPTASLAKKFIEKLGSDNLRVLWDPANTLYFNEVPYPDGYNLIKEYIVHVHIKDGVVDLPNCSFTMCPPGQGQVKTYPEILRSLEEDGYQGAVCIDNEYVPEGGTLEDGTRICFDELKKMVK